MGRQTGELAARKAQLEAEIASLGANEEARGARLRGELASLEEEEAIAKAAENDPTLTVS